MTTTPDLTRLEVRQAHLVALVRRGTQVRDAAAEVHISPKTVQHWRDRTPGFAERLDQARRDARAMAKQREQEQFFALVRTGMSATAALARLGYAPGQAQNWRKAGRPGAWWFNSEYRRLIGPTGQSRPRFDRLMRALGSGMSITRAAHAAGYDESSVYKWRTRRPDLWARVVETMEAARDTAEGRLAA